ncbi:MAG: transglycosylase domain-containing protein [Lachnospiraceae bacterium]|nr:transglycosylase domain-containing protein [Lachnospiraceae bacterium]MDE7274635.1 transglycosylase domain-containing protein [Lachnospiraceae bacterium]
MNYGKRGVAKVQKSLTSKSIKFQKFFFVSMLKIILIGTLSLMIVGVCFGIGAFKGILSCAPDVDPAAVLPQGFATVVYDAKGNELTRLVAANSNRSSETIDKIPQYLCDAFVAIEDQRFYEHNGIDIKRILSAGLIALRDRELSQGASTITQQIIKNNVFDNWTNESEIQKIKRKIQEQYLALELEKKMSKEQILEIYMNTINLGQNTLGVKAAALRYFNKQPYQLTLSECAVIAATTSNPSRYNPISHPDSNKTRRDIVLENMKEQGYITQAEYDQAMADDVYSRILAVNEETEINSVYTYFVDEVTEQVIADLMEIKGFNETQAHRLLFSGGLSIYTTQDPDIQAICDEVYENEENYPQNTKWYLNYVLTIEKANGEKENHSTEMFRAHYREQNASFNLIYATQDEAYEAIEAYKHDVMAEGDKVESERITLTPQPQVSITVEDQSTGYIVALVGGRGTKEASRTLNRATNTTRQPGSTFKVVSTYAPALDSAGLTLADVQNDAPFNYTGGRPVRNWWGSNYRGLLSLRYGIAQSANVVAVKTLTQISPQLGFDYLQNFGFTTLVEKRVEKDGTIVSDIGQPLALGGITDGVTNLELNAAYATIANQGTYIKPKLYTKILDHDGNVLIDNTAPESTQVIKQTTAWLLTSAMVDVVTTGTGGSVNFGNMAIAGKTGTTSDYKDVWFSGFTPYYTATTWTGYDNNVSMTTSAEKNLSKTMWKAVMSRIHADLEYKSFPMANGIVTASICSKSGKLPIAGVCDSEGCVKTEYFAEGTVPTEYCDVHYFSNTCMYCGLTATEECPFKQASIIEQIPARLQDNNLASALTSLPETETTENTQLCPHDSTFMTAPNAQEVLQMQIFEMQQRAGDATAAPPTPVAPTEPVSDTD